MIKQITIAEAQTLLAQENATVIDIRDAISFANGHIKNAIRVDNENFQSFVDTADKNIPVIVCCYHGNSSQAATSVLDSLGFNGHSLIGGMSDWMLSNSVVQEEK